MQRTDIVCVTASYFIESCTFLTEKDLSNHTQCSQFMKLRLREVTCVSKDTLKMNQDSLLRHFPVNLLEGKNRQMIIIQQICIEPVLFFEHCDGYSPETLHTEMRDT